MLKLIEGAEVEPVTLEEAKSFLRVDVSDDDTQIGSLITAARGYAEHYAQCSFAAQTWELGLNTFPFLAIELQNPPVTDVVSIKYTDAAGVEQTLSESAYTLDDYGLTARIWPIDDVWPVTSIADIPNAVRVRYTAGACPAMAKTAILEMLAHLYENREEGVVPSTVARLLDTVKVYA